MKFLSTGLVGLMVALGTLVAPPAFALDATNPQHVGSIERTKASRAVELRDAAVAFLKHNGPQKAFEAFNDPKGSFIYEPYYVFVVGTDGTMYANGGTQLAAAGKNALDMRDAAGKPLIRDLLALAAQTPVGSIEYRMLNEHNIVELKAGLYSKVDPYIISIGYYTPRASQADALALLERAVAYVKNAGPDTAFAAFNSPQGGFTYDDQYVFVIGIEDGKYRASGASPQLNGMDVRGLKDAAGYSLFEDMIGLAKTKGSGTVRYVWRNPATNAVETKSSLIQRVGDVLLGVGYYTK
jgi:cytochrome c